MLARCPHIVEQRPAHLRICKVDVADFAKHDGHRINVARVHLALEVDAPSVSDPVVLGIYAFSEDDVREVVDIGAAIVFVHLERRIEGEDAVCIQCGTQLIPCQNGLVVGIWHLGP